MVKNPLPLLSFLQLPPFFLHLVNIKCTTQYVKDTRPHIFKETVQTDISYMTTQAFGGIS
jgi:hypothetical protein